ncbi:hypothetical protein ACFQ0D_36225, partial [Micromonospora zhanjiangensis]
MNQPRAALHDLIGGQVRQHDRRLRRFSEPDWQRYADLLSGAFLLAVRRRFRPGQERAPIIRFVATVRERFDHTGHDLDPVIAERLVWAALGEGKPEPATSAAMAAQTLLVLGLLEDEGMAETELDEFLATADTLARTAPTGAEAAPPETDSPVADQVAADPDGDGVADVPVAD